MRKLLRVFGVIALCISLVFAVQSLARVERDVLLVTTTSGAATAFTINTALNSRKVTFQADNGNSTDIIYVGDASLDATSTATLQATAHASLSAGTGYTPVPSAYAGNNGHSWQLSTFRASGATGAKVRLVYEVITP